MVDFSNKHKAEILRLVHFFVKVPNAIRGQNAQLLHHTASLVSETVAFWVDDTSGLQFHQFCLLVLNTLHLGVDDAGILTRTIDMVDFRVAASVGQSW